MKKTWSIFCVAALLALTLAGCAGNMTQGAATNTPGADSTQAIPGTADSGDLAGEDGMVDGKADKDDAGKTDKDDAAKASDSPLEKAGDDIRDTVDDLGDAARGALDSAGRAAKDAGRDAKDAIEGK